jgi:hypothetical protein
VRSKLAAHPRGPARESANSEPAGWVAVEARFSFSN